MLDYLTESDPNNERLELSLASAYIGNGDSLRYSSDYLAAIKTYNTANSIATKYANSAQFPEEWTSNTIVVQKSLGDAYIQGGGYIEGLDHFTNCISLGNAALVKYPGSKDIAHHVISCNISLADTLLDLNKLVEARRQGAIAASMAAELDVKFETALSHRDAVLAAAELLDIAFAQLKSNVGQFESGPHVK